jgi:hypothetical protein
MEIQRCQRIGNAEALADIALSWPRAMVSMWRRSSFALRSSAPMSALPGGEFRSI